jgi:hypothetical protein
MSWLATRDKGVVRRRTAGHAERVWSIPAVALRFNPSKSGISDMRSLVAALSLLASSGTALADEPAPKPADVSAAVDRGLAFLVKDALAWKNDPLAARRLLMADDFAADQARR